MGEKLFVGQKIAWKHHSDSKIGFILSNDKRIEKTGIYTRISH